MWLPQAQLPSATVAPTAARALCSPPWPHLPPMRPWQALPGSACWAPTCLLQHSSQRPISGSGLPCHGVLPQVMEGLGEAHTTPVPQNL